ncbi:MAG: adenosylcobinamide-phosphate synthase CbiB [Caldimicrobium sp.]
MDLFTVKGYQIALAFFLDFILGDPKNFPHPVKGIGKTISLLEPPIRKIPLFNDKIRGIFFFFAVNFITLFVSFLFLQILIQLKKISPFLAEGVFFLTLSLFLALRSLVDAGLCVEKYLSQGELELARRELKALVGRDTDKLDEKGIRRAVLESYAENLNDGVIAPLFWLTLLGFPGMVFYKTVNTLDSMVGYKNEKYKNFGWFSAKMDDLVNLIPARITALLIVLASFFYLGINSGLRSFKWIFKYAKLHPSPNGGYPESALSGALGVRLLGPAYYNGELIVKPYIGENLINNFDKTIFIAKNLLIMSAFFMLIIILLFKGIK